MRATLISSAPSGSLAMDRAELERQLAALHAGSFGWALVCCRWSRAEADDALQTAYLKVLDGRARFDGHSSFKIWLFSVVRKTAVDQSRRAVTQRMLGALGLGRPVEPPIAPDREAEESARGTRIRAALLSLPGRQREVLELVFFHELTVEEAANVMGVTVGSARVHYDRAKRRLRERLNAEDL